MGVTFTNEPLGNNFRHHVVTENGHYVMGKSWIDTTCPRDMMDYDMTQSMNDAKQAAADTHALWCRLQTA